MVEPHGPELVERWASNESRSTRGCGRRRFISKGPRRRSSTSSAARVSRCSGRARATRRLRGERRRLPSPPRARERPYAPGRPGRARRPRVRAAHVRRGHHAGYRGPESRGSARRGRRSAPRTTIRGRARRRPERPRSASSRRGRRRSSMSRISSRPSETRRRSAGASATRGASWAPSRRGSVTPRSSRAS